MKDKELRRVVIDLALQIEKIEKKIKFISTNIFNRVEDDLEQKPKKQDPNNFVGGYTIKQQKTTTQALRNKTYKNNRK